MATNTYVALDKITLGTATNTLTFSSIPSTYTDLVIVANYGTTAAGNSIFLRLNGDTGSNYSGTFLLGSGTTASSYVGGPNESSIRVFGSPIASGTPSTLIATGLIHIQNYSNSTTNKTVLARSGQGTGEVLAGVGLYRSTAAVTSVTLYMAASSILAGSTFSLYGIKSEAAAAKATGGYVTSDATYFYHTFLASGTFTPTQSLTADVLVVAGGGGGMTGKSGTYLGSGGGAGQVSLFSSNSLVVSTAYTATIGSGGAGTASGTLDTNGSNGVASSFIGGVISNSTSVGQGGQFNTGTGGSSGNGFSGGNPSAPQGGAGAGAAANGGNAPSAAGGAGTNTYSAWATATGTGVSGYYAGGGGGTYDGIGGSGGGGLGGRAVGVHNGTANTGSGGGGGNYLDTNAGNGGSGLVIVRYAKA